MSVYKLSRFPLTQFPLSKVIEMFVKGIKWYILTESSNWRKNAEHERLICQVKERKYEAVSNKQLIISGNLS